MRIDIITALPRLLESPFNDSIIQRAQKRELAEIHIHDLRAYGTGKHRQIDDYQYGGGAGMVMMLDPLFRCIEDLREKRDYNEIIYMTPDGELFDQPLANRLSLHKNLLLLCGHYKGIDQRIRDHIVTRDLSIGSYVLSGGELAAAIVSDAIIRLLPGVLNDESSALSDSFQDQLLAPPVYTRPAEYKGWKVPDILLSGDFPKIQAWREEQAWKLTREKRPDLLGGEELDSGEKK